MGKVKIQKLLLITFICVSAAIGLVYYSLKPKDSTPPEIELSWIPSRIVNDKVYDINVSLIAEDGQTPIAYAELGFIPEQYDYMIENYGMRQEDYHLVFPDESSRTMILLPRDGELDECKEEFEVLIKNIMGGREYRIVALVKDQAGNAEQVEIKTPYIRQFENVAPLDDILVGTYYYSWYDEEKRHWSEGYTGKSLLGEYYSGDTIVVSKHIDWMTGHGIDFILPSWWGAYYEGWKGEPDRNFRIFLNNTLIKDIKFGINYESLGRLKYSVENGDISINMSDPENIGRLISDFDYLSQTYFDNPSILKIENRIFVFFYLARCFTGDVQSAFQQLRESLKQKGWEIYVVGDEVYWQDPFSQTWSRRIKFYDAVTSYNMLEAPEKVEDFENLVDKKYSEWFAACKNFNFIPDVLPGYDDRVARPSANNPVLPKSTKRFEEQISIAFKYLGEKKILLITTFNEWHEFTAIEPCLNETFSYLEMLKNYLARKD